MPLYDFKCKKCKEINEHICSISEREEQLCETCGEVLIREIGVGRYIPFKEGWYEHIAKDPIYISSMRQLKRECADRGLTSIYAEDSR